MDFSRKRIMQDEALKNLLDAQKNMASADTVDAKGLIRLSRFLLHLLNHLDDEIIQLGTKEGR